MNGGGGSAGGELQADQRLADEHLLDEHLVDEHLVDEHCRRAPAEPLRRYVAWYTGYRQRGMPPARHRGLPSPFLTLIFTLDEPLTVLAHPDPEQPPGDFGSLLGGLHSAPGRCSAFRPANWPGSTCPPRRCSAASARSCGPGR